MCPEPGAGSQACGPREPRFSAEACMRARVLSRRPVQRRAVTEAQQDSVRFDAQHLSAWALAVAPSTLHHVC